MSASALEYRGSQPSTSRMRSTETYESLSAVPYTHRYSGERLTLSSARSASLAGHAGTGKTRAPEPANAHSAPTSSRTDWKRVAPTLNVPFAAPVGAVAER